jgi:hypothetical protein
MGFQLAAYSYVPVRNSGTKEVPVWFTGIYQPILSSELALHIPTCTSFAQLA